MTRMRTTDATRTFQDLSYTYDVVGNIVEIGDGAQEDVYFGGAVVTARQRYEYDALYRLTDAEGREHIGQHAAQPSEFGANASAHPQDGTAMRAYAEAYVYDVVGNILEMQHAAAGGNWTRRYQYAANGNRLQATSLPGDAAGQHSATYGYDAHGNMSSMPHLSAVRWNYADQMRSADLGGGGTVYFVYDGAGQRVRKVSVNQAGTQTTERIYLGAYELYRERTNGSQLERETLHIADDSGRMCDVETRTVEAGSAVATPTTHHRYQYSNHLGSASLELTGSAEVISYEEYHPYGTSSYRAVNSSIDVSERTYRYTGKERDEETGLGYHGARYYACWLGRWTASDPIGLGDGVNRYGYVSGNPVGFVDPGGSRKTPAEMAALRQEVAKIRKDAISQAQSDLLENGRELVRRQVRYDSLVDSGEATPLQLSNAQRDLAEYRTRSLASIDRLAYAYEHGVLPDWQIARLKIAELKLAEIEILQGNSPRGFDEDAFERDNRRELALEVGEGVLDDLTPAGTLKDANAAAERGDLIAVAGIIIADEVLPNALSRKLRRVGRRALRRFGKPSGPKLNERTRRHMLDGDPGDPGSGHGPNRGSRTGAFPDTWNDDQAAAAVERVAGSPDSTWMRTRGPGDKAIHQGGPAPGEPTQTLRGHAVRHKVRGRDHGLDIEVIVEGDTIVTGYVR